jgi:hypothetical protein
LLEEKQYFLKWSGNSGIPASSVASGDSSFSQFKALSTAVMPVESTDETASLQSGTDTAKRDDSNRVNYFIS